MSRQKRSLRRKYIIFCEGDTEHNYFDKMRKIQGVELSLKPINMCGGGYSNFLKKIKDEPNSNCLAKFVIVDMDRAISNPEEEKCLKELIEYCRSQNKKEIPPYFVIIDNPDFEYVACLHSPLYRGGSTKDYIEKGFGFKDLDVFKSYANVYDYLNQNGNSFVLALNLLRQRSSYIKNVYSLKPKSFEIKVTKTIVDDTSRIQRGSNIYELFDVIEWH